MNVQLCSEVNKGRKTITVNVTQQCSQIVAADGLESDTHNMACISTDGVEETSNVDNQIGRGVNFRPEQLEIALLQDVGEKNYVLNSFILHLSGQQ